GAAAWRYHCKVFDVMPGLAPGIHVFPFEDVDGRDEPGHDKPVNDLYIKPRPAPSGFLALETCGEHRNESIERGAGFAAPTAAVPLLASGHPRDGSCARPFCRHGIGRLERS